MIRRAVGIASPGWSTMGAVAGFCRSCEWLPSPCARGATRSRGSKRYRARVSVRGSQWISGERWMPSKRFDNLSIILPSQVRTVFERIESNHP